jgi:hypothetical protein
MCAGLKKHSLHYDCIFAARSIHVRAILAGVNVLRLKALLEPKANLGLPLLPQGFFVDRMLKFY